MPQKHRIHINLEYFDKETCVREFERVVQMLKDQNYPRCCAGAGSNQYGVSGPSVEPLTDHEIEKLRALIK